MSDRIAPADDDGRHGGAADSPHEILTIEGHGGHPIRCRLWDRDGARATLVTVHGVVGHSLWLEPLARRLAGRGVRTLAMDRRGAGLNHEARGDAPSADALVGDLEAVLRRASADDPPVHLCGFCWGSVYAVDTLAALAARPASTRTGIDVRSAIHIAPSLFPTPLVLGRRFRTGDSGIPTEEPVMPIDCFTDGPALEDFIVPDPLRLRKVSPRLNACMARFSAGIWMKLLRRPLPSLVLLAADDRVVDNAATERLFGRLDADPVRVHTLPGAHGIQFDAPDAAAALVADWVLGATSAAGAASGGAAEDMD